MLTRLILLLVLSLGLARPAVAAATTADVDVIVGDDTPLPDLVERKQNGLKAQSSGRFALAWELLLPVAESGDVDAQYQMGWLSEQGWEGFPGDLNQAAAWHRRAAEQGHSRSQLWLGYHLAGRMSAGAAGQGGPELMMEGIRWLVSAGQKGNVEAQMLLGDIFWDGSGYILKNRENGRYWYKKAAAAGNNMARIMLLQQ